ncbi:MAG: hypothetical protein GXO69_08570 [Acidobacteria bacterium]|nr:hypothetical protein [Acidobacteriota bacterium]
MSETRNFLNQLKKEGLIRADLICGKEHIKFRKKTLGHISEKDSGMSHRLKTQLTKKKNVSPRNLFLILGSIFLLAILISVFDSNISGYYKTVFGFGAKHRNTETQNNADLSSAALASLDNSGRIRELIHAVQNGNLEITRKLLELETDINAKNKDGNTPLVAAIMSNQKNIANFLLDKGASLDTPAKNGITPVMAAARKADASLLSRLLKNGAKANLFDKNGNSALIYAVKSNCAPCVKMLLKRGIDPNVPDGEGNTALILAASKRNSSISELLLKNGAKVNMTSPNGTTALIKAAETGNIDLVRLLLAAGATINLKSANGSSALSTAAANKHADIVHLLIQTAKDNKISLSNTVSILNRALQNNNRMVAAQMILSGIRKPLPTPPVTGTDLKNWQSYKQILRKTIGKKTTFKLDESLRKAAGNGEIKKILSTLKAGADPGATNADKENAVMLAVRNHRLKALKLLLDYGAPVEVIGRQDGESPLLIAARLTDPRFAALLLQAGADPNLPGLNGYTALDYAFAAGNRLVIPILAKAGALAATQWNKNQWTPLEFVIASGKGSMLDMLIRNSTNIDKTDTNGWSALHYAVMLGKPSLVKKLLKNGADINLRDTKDWNPLHFAVLAGRLDILKILLGNGAKVNRRNNANWPPLYLAIALRHPDMTKALLNAGAKTRYKTDSTVVLPPISFPKRIRAADIAAKLLRHNPKDAIAKEIQKLINSKQ